jgi:hypothetical protein
MIGRTPLLTASRRRAVRDGLVLAGLIFTAYVIFVAAPSKGTLAVDVVAYWGVDLADPYGGLVGDLGFFAYSPPVAALLYPFTQLPWIAFVAGWYALLLGALVWLGRRDLLVLLAFPPIAINLSDGNVHIFLAAAIVIGFRYPAAWAVVLLTKVTSGIGLLWFVARREWRQLAIALGATAGIVAVSAVLMPTQWVAYVRMLSESAAAAPPWPALPIPLWLRLPVAAAVIWWGARRDLRWTVPIGAALALPALWLGGFAILAAVWPLRSRAAGSSVSSSPASTDTSATVAPVGAVSVQSGGYHAADALEPTGSDARPSTA